MENQNRTFMIPEGKKKQLSLEKIDICRFENDFILSKLNKQIEWLLILFHNCGRYKRKR